MEINEITGRNLKRLREEHDMTQQQLAEAIDATDKSTVSALERGTVALTGKRLKLLCEIFSCAPDEFFKLNGHSDAIEGMIHEEVAKMDKEQKAKLYAQAVSINAKH